VKSKDLIEQEELYKILKQMPKCGMLHFHTTATGDANWIVEMTCPTIGGADLSQETEYKSLILIKLNVLL